MAFTLSPELQKQKYVNLTTFRKNGLAVNTPVWFAARDGKLMVMTRNDSGKYKRIRNNPAVRLAPCNIRGKITDPAFPGRARILAPEEWPEARKAIQAKYWLMGMSALWSKNNIYVEITL